MRYRTTGADIVQLSSGGSLQDARASIRARAVLHAFPTRTAHANWPIKRHYDEDNSLHSARIGQQQQLLS